MCCTRLRARQCRASCLSAFHHNCFILDGVHMARPAICALLLVGWHCANGVARMSREAFPENMNSPSLHQSYSSAEKSSCLLLTGSLVPFISPIRLQKGS